MPRRCEVPGEAAKVNELAKRNWQTDVHRKAQEPFPRGKSGGRGSQERDTKRQSESLTATYQERSLTLLIFLILYLVKGKEREYTTGVVFFSPRVGFRLTWPVVLPTEPSHQTTLFLLTGNLGRLILLKAPDIEIPSVWGFIIREGIKEKWGNLHSAPHMLRSQVWHRERLSCHVE